MLARRSALLAVAAAVHFAPPPATAAADSDEPPAGAEDQSSIALPAVGVVSGELAPVRARPTGRARQLQVLRLLRPDARLQVVLVVGRHRDALDRLWYRVRLQRRPNGTRGWVLASRLNIHRVRTRIVVRRAARTLTVRRGGRVLLRTRIAVGAPGARTPLGSFYVTARFRPRLGYLGAYAFETSAYSRLSDWPGGGIVGIHGTDQPQLLGQAVSHGCIRMSNRAVRRMRMLIPLGAPISIRR
ncbi:MAG TPA: L,D-transpeptidase [Solirubrobacteraceae bacterium]|nr:L,D-transpeptidase [Solirubrobacteraceae bacterium]